MQQSCDAYANTVTTSITVDARAVAFATVACGYHSSNPFPGGSSTVSGPQWVTDMRYLSPPLSRGAHTATVTLTYHAAVPYWSGCMNQTPPCYSTSGETATFQQIITVS